MASCNAAASLRAAVIGSEVERILLGGGGVLLPLQIPLGRHVQKLRAHGSFIAFGAALNLGMRGGCEFDDNLFHVGLGRWQDTPLVWVASHLCNVFFENFTCRWPATCECSVLMPNSRAKGKKKLQAWMTDAQRLQIASIAEDLGFDNVTEFLQAVAEGRLVVEPPDLTPADVVLRHGTRSLHLATGISEGVLALIARGQEQKLDTEDLSALAKVITPDELEVMRSLVAVKRGKKVIDPLPTGREPQTA